jgi:hypothetical protein
MCQALRIHEFRTRKPNSRICKALNATIRITTVWKNCLASASQELRKRKLHRAQKLTFLTELVGQKKGVRAAHAVLQVQVRPI